jgi:hypothetical protein
VEIAFSNRARSQYEQLCEEFAFCDGNLMPAVFNERQRARLWTFAGSAVNGPLSQALAGRGFGVDTFDNFSLTISRGAVRIASDSLRTLNTSEFCPSISASLGRALKFSACLPQGEAAAILAERLRDEKDLEETIARPMRRIIK